MRLLLFSNSTNAGEPYLDHTLPHIREFLPEGCERAIFIPYAGISVGYDKYYQMVKEPLAALSIEVQSIHNQEDPLAAIERADLIVVGGGNTFVLLRELQHRSLLTKIREKVLAGTPYMGWSAGANMACPTIRTTNDMPVVEPDSFSALGLIPFQINPHFSDFVQPGHAGETREMRINEFLIANPDIYVAGLREGSLFQFEDGVLRLKGPHSCKIFRLGQDPVEISPADNISFLMQ